jgi:RHS repeat-associated protein
MTDDSGTVVWEADYKPFGEATVNPNSSVVSNFRFPGQYYDQETGLHYNYHRYYDPKTGRYLRPDPIGLAGGINLFPYASNNPINLIDPFGLWGLNLGGSLIGVDFSTTIYDSKKGWFPISQPNLGVSTTLFGGGFQFAFDTPIHGDPCSEDDLNISWGLSRYLGMTYNTELTKGSVNIGLGLGLPVSFSSSVERFSKGLYNGLSKIFSN